MGRRCLVLAVALTVSQAACSGIQTQLGSVSQDQVAIEAARQQQFALQLALKQQHRLQNVAVPLLEAAVPLCGAKVRGASGFVATNAYGWKKDYFTAALASGYNDTLTIINVVPGSAAAEAGLKPGDRIVAVDGRAIIPGPKSIEELTARLPNPKEQTPRPYALTYRRGTDSVTTTIKTHASCAYTPQVVDGDEINAYADGHSVFVTSGIMRFFNSDDDLAVIVSHEIAHDAMHHIDAKAKNSLVGALLGAVVDVAAATQGVNTDFARTGAQLGSMVFSQDFEREADYVGLYILALSNRPIVEAANVWRQLGAAKPGSIKFATSHPTTAERFVRLDNWRSEIDRKIASNASLMPEMKNATTMVAMVPARAKSGAALPSVRGPGEAAAIPQARKNRDATGHVASALGERKTVTDRNASDKSVGEMPPSSGKFEREAPRGAHAIIGAPSSDSARLAAIDKFAEGRSYMGRHQWSQAEKTFRTTLTLDGSVAEYHASLGRVLMLLGKYDEAQAEYTAATLLDLDNASYRRLLKEARSKR